MATRTLSRQRSEFLYDHVCKSILQMIRQDSLQPGDRLPSERELARRFGLNHQTVRKGLAVLVEENIIDRRVGAGTFLRCVPEEAAVQSLTMRSSANGRSSHSPITRNCATVGVVVLTGANTFVTQLLHHLHEEAEKRELTLSLRTVSDLGPRTEEVIQQLVDQGCASVLIPWLPVPHPMTELTRLIHGSPVPVVLASPLPGLEECCYEKPSEFGKADHIAVEMACKYLQSLGYGHIGFFGPDKLATESLGGRVLAYNRFTSRQGLGSYVGLVNPDAGDVDRIVRGWSSMAGDLAVLCFDDDSAIRLMTSMHKLNLRIPDDVAVLGFNNIPLGNFTDPPLSTIQFDYSYVARSMLEHAQATADGRPARATGPVREILVIRESCGGHRRVGDRLSQIIADVQSMWNETNER